MGIVPAGRLKVILEILRLLRTTFRDKLSTTKIKNAGFRIRDFAWFSHVILRTLILKPDFWIPTIRVANISLTIYNWFGYVWLLKSCQFLPCISIKNIITVVNSSQQKTSALCGSLRFRFRELRIWPWCFSDTVWCPDTAFEIVYWTPGASKMQCLKLTP